MSNSRDLASRLRQGLNPLLTSSLGGYQNQVGTPLSAISISTHAYSTNQTTPSSAIQPYNPQQWVASPAVGPERTHQFSAGPEASPLPPPPYSPPRSQRPVSQVFESPAIQVSRPQTQHRPSPDPPAQPNPIFPPPPGASGRGASRERSRFLPSLGRRNQTTQETVTPPEPHPSASRPGLRVVIPQDAAVPPNARRAASTPAIGTPTSSRSRSSSQIRWDPMTMGSVPPPPPGPPPSQSRSQSVSRTNDLGRHPEMTLSPPTRRPPPGGVSALGPVPPTPANWVDSDHPQMSRSRSPSGMETPGIGGSIVGSPSTALDSAATGSPEQVSSGGTLARARAVRGEKSLRERRAESRSRHASHGSIDATLEHQLSDIVIPNGPGLTRRLTITRNTPRSSKSSVEVPRNGDQADQHHSQGVASSTSTPRALGSAASHHPETPTPPFSPHPQKPYAMAEPSPSIAPKALPTPPPQNRSVSQTRRASSRASSVDIRSGPPSPKLTRQAVVKQTPDQFCMATVERFQRFAQKEAYAASDAERVRLFAEFMVNESRIRRERYAQAIGAMGSEIFDLTRDLFRPMVGRRESTGSQAGEMASQRSDSRVRDLGHSSSSVPSSAGIESSPVAGSSGTGNNWNSNNFMPSLSPILSMSVSEHHDESSSRGRPASRWWETDSSGRGSMRIERSKRESKYMGVTLESWTEPEAGPSSYQNSTEYPPEKVGWHEPELSTTPQTLRSSMLSNATSSPNTPSAIRSNSNPHALDVSRLVTLPPPYPRHHPAVNNNHPNLTSIRNQVRQLSDFTEVEQTKSRFKADSDKAREEAAAAAAQRKASLRTNLQQEIGSGNMSYAEAAAIEADAVQSERSIEKELSKKDFDAFQHQVIMPLNDLLVGRIAQATSLFDELRSRLFEEHQNNNPDMPQEEGDETPELLEKLTLLKWIFEARESLHRAIYDLLSDRNDRYRDMIITPYKLAGNEEKLRNAQAFFADDAQKRAVTFADESLKRSQEFRDVIEENVVRGVEVQLSAFWDIAPPLKRVLDKIPADVGHGFSIQIPPSEYEENPAYHQHPMQYLYSLLLHAEKSTYQFIESQTNLLCLLHEVKETVTLAKAKVMTEEARDEDRVKEVKAEEEARLTEDLKEKVRVVGDQWADALGEAFSSVKERVGEWLLQTGGWDESLEDGGVGAP